MEQMEPMATRRPCVLVLAGLDPSGGAGLLADAEAVRESGARPLCVATALTVQTSRAARNFAPVPAALVEQQARALLEEEPVAAVKLGMLATPALAAAALAIAGEARVPLVVDPVLRASSGAPLFDGDARAAYLPLFAGAVVTPNLGEAAALLGLAAPPADVASMAEAARALVALGARAALVKGGHLEGEAVDVLCEGAALHELRAARLAAGARGTGCRLASALAARLALGDSLLGAARFAKLLVRRYLEQAPQ
jgi:hydroxymethylpyrimidine/phosphomethylpyrimidine kinase